MTAGVGDGIVRKLLAWFTDHGRDLPWRRTRDPYRVLVSEVMLQQTQVDRVMPKYREFIRRFPSLKSLAAADPAEVRRRWSPLGYNIRPYRLHSIAREARARYGGRLPDTEEGLMTLDGIGRYTAAAVLAFAHHRDVVAVDTNVARVLHRVFVGRGDPRRPAARERVRKVAETLLPRGRAWEFNSALMDLGATICVARRPRCPSCPLRAACTWVRV